MAGPHPAVASVRSAVRAVLRGVDGAQPRRVLVACSGGADSLALAAAVAFEAPRAGVRAGAVVVDHGLLDGSADVARRAAAQCSALGLDPVTTVRVRVAADGDGPEASARTARYDAIEAVARRWDAEAGGAGTAGEALVLLGHTLDDEAEQVLLGLARGSGARSLAGIPPRRGRLRRPLLGVRREATEAACAALGLEVWHDPTNLRGAPRDAEAAADAGGSGAPGDAGAPRRSLVRARVLPVLEEVLGPGVAEALARTAAQLREDADVLDALAEALLEEAVHEARALGGAPPRAPGPGASYAVDVLAAAPPAVRRRAVRALVVDAGAPAGRVRRSHVLAVDALLTDWRGQGPVHLPGRVEVVRRCGRLETVVPGPR